MQPATGYAQLGDQRIANQVMGGGPIDLVVTAGFWSSYEVDWHRGRLATPRRHRLTDRGATRPGLVRRSAGATWKARSWKRWSASRCSIIIATAAGAPFLPKLAVVAKGDIAYSVGLMVLLMVVTVVYMPIALPLLLEGVEVNAWDIASSLIFLMILPLAIGLFFKWRYEGVADTLEPLMGQVSTVAIAFLVVGGIVVAWDDIVGLLGTRGILAALLLIIGSLIIGYLAGGSDSRKRSVLGLGTGQRNLSAAFVVAVQNFSDDGDVLAFIIVAGMVGLVILMLSAGELGRRSDAAVDA